MQIIPAIDMKNGKCVRLTQGDFSREKIYSDDPISIAQQWEKEGATMLHLVDLDGAKKGKIVHEKIIRKMVKSVSIPIQFGGGIRDKATVATVLEMGISRVILGTLVLEDTRVLQNILADFASSVVVALDAKNGKLMKQGWFVESMQETVSFAKELASLGVQRLIYTDVVNDGMMLEPNYEMILAIKNAVTMPIIVGGGIATCEALRKLRTLNVEGAIIGKALYEGKIEIKEAIKC
jgi:phosphoribosylformimino-5-aminoimidazole carboxamide ribotide isomerase